MRAGSDPDIQLLRGIADPSRLAILRRLQCGGSVAACAFDCCEVRQPTISHHLRVLREAGWVRAERRGSGALYSIEPAAAERFRAIAADLDPTPAAQRSHRTAAHAGDSAAGPDVDRAGPPSPRPRRAGR